VEFEINDKSPAHPYVQLAGQLRDKIASGEIADKLPSITELIAASGLTTNTVQRALRILKAEDLIYGVPGRGTFVRRGEG
jgi:DNA-binding GntR family transcriptional regulator